jgi:hypothetical protein
MSAPFVAVIGTQSSGSSAIAGVAYHVGVWMGDDLGGRYGKDPDDQCGFEDRALWQLVKEHVKFLDDRILRRRLFLDGLAQRINQLQRQAARRNQIAGMKLPRLSRLGTELIELVGRPNLWVIDCDRPLEDSVKSLQRRQPNRRNAAELQQWLWDGKKTFLAQVPAERKLAVPYYNLLADPEAWARKIAAFLHLTPTDAQVLKAVQIVHPEMQHIGD